MNKAQLIERISEKTKFTQSQCKKFLDSTIEIIQETVSHGVEVKIVGFGSFERVDKKARTGRNLNTGASVLIPETRAPRFKPGKDFKEMVLSVPTATTSSPSSSAKGHGSSKSSTASHGELQNSQNGTQKNLEI